MVDRKFKLGAVIVTSSARTFHERTGADLGALLKRHAAGDWGDMPPAEKAKNDLALLEQQPLLSAYKLGTDGSEVIHIATEFEPHYTMVHGPE